MTRSKGNLKNLSLIKKRPRIVPCKALIVQAFGCFTCP